MCFRYFRFRVAFGLIKGSPAFVLCRCVTINLAACISIERVRPCFFFLANVYMVLQFPDNLKPIQQSSIKM